MKEEKGITLIALVFTIIVIMILASIAVYSGVSTLKYSRFNKAKNELEIMQTYVNEWYREYKNVVVKDDEVLPGQTREEIKAVRQSEIIKKYGETTAVSSCNQDTLRSTLLVFLTETELANELALDPENRDYRFFSESYLKTNFGMNASYDFLVNIPTRTVILFGGLIYNGKIYFTPEQFGLLNVLTTEMKGITFNVSQGKRKEVIISDVKLKDNTSRESDISKFIVQYKKESENIWKTVKPSDLTKFTETTEVDGQNITTTKYKFLVEEYTDYHIKVTSQDKNLDGVYTLAMIEPRAIFQTGQQVNAKMKQLAGNDGATYNTVDSKIKEIKRAEEISSANKIDANIVSTNESNTSIYMWYESAGEDEGIIWYYSDDEKPELNEDSSYMFLRIYKIKNIDLKEIDTSNVTNMEYLFSLAGYQATSFNIEGLSTWNVAKVINMHEMFYCVGYNATTWDIGNLSNWDVSNVENMVSMFQNAGKSATTWNIGDLSNWDVSNVTNMSIMFSHAGQSATIWNIGNLSNWNVSSVTKMNNMFCAGQSATTWNIGNLSNWDVSNVTEMEGMFSHAGQSATTWNIGNLSNWDVSNVINMREMFSYAGQSATTWDIGNLSNWDTSKLPTNINDRLSGMMRMFEHAGEYATTWNSIGTLKIYTRYTPNMFLSCPKAKATLNIYNKPTSYDNMFDGAATASGSSIIVNYSSVVTNIDSIIGTKSDTSNVSKGSQLD